MASVRKRGNSYQITVSNGRYQDGSQIIETATYTPEPGMTPRQIEKALEQFKVDFERSVKAGENVKGQQMKLSDLAALFLEDNKPSNPPADTDPLSITTWAEYRRALNKRILPRIGHIKIGEVIPKTMKDYAKVMRQDGARQDGKPGGLSEGTITKDLATVSTLLSYAVGEGLLQVNTLIYAGKQSKGRKKKVEYKVKCLTIEQTQALLWALDNPIRIKYGRRYRLTADGKSYPVKAYYQDWSLSLKWRAYFYLSLFMGDRRGDDDDKIRLNQRKPSKYKGLRRFGPEKNLQRINKFMKERPIFYKNLIQMKENIRFYLRCFYCITKVMILQFNSENRTELARNG